MTGPTVEARAVRFRYPGAEQESVTDVSLDLTPGELVAVVGPNGSGKTTLLRLLAGAFTPTGGTVTVDRADTRRWNRRELARLIAVVAQREEPAFPLRVHQAVMLGRYPHIGVLGGPGRHDRDAVRSALDRCDVGDLADRWVATLSGGEWQRVRVARALAQDPRVLLLDEATSNLDLRHEMEVFALVAALVRESRLAGLFITHQVNLASRFADRVLVMRRGIAHALGPPAEVLTAELVRQVFEWPVDVYWWQGHPQFIPLATGGTGGESS